MILNEKLIAEKWQFKKREWPERMKAIAEIIPKGASILELGGGLCGLSAELPDNPYRSVDIEEWTDCTTKADFNAGEYPEIPRHDVIVCAGLLEYIRDPEKFLFAIHGYGRRVLLSYYNGKECPTRKNKLKFAWLERLFKRTGWEILMMRELDTHQKIYFITQK
jgi:hypothetical protein